jgi:hypothetical protein
VKRGWITWDRTELPLSAFENRLHVVRKSLADRQLPALVVYTDIWKSNPARHLSNFMPYWNRALLVIPQGAAPVLICGLSPRVYPWIRSVTILDEIRPGANLPQQLLQMCAEKSWKEIGVLDLPQLPNDLHAPIVAAIKTVDLPSDVLHLSKPDEFEIAMHRTSARMTREILEEELRVSSDGPDYQLAGRLERKFRRAGVEDLVILITNGRTPPRPANGSMLGETFSVALAVEFRGHWVKVARPRVPADVFSSVRERFNAAINNPEASGEGAVRVENLSGPYPYETQDPKALVAGSIQAVHVEVSVKGERLFYGDTCLHGEKGAELL